MWIVVAVTSAAGAVAWVGASPDPTPKPGPAETVVLIHGLGRTSDSMKSMAEHLSGQGFRVVKLDYPSTEEAPDALVAHVAAEVQRCCAKARRVHFVAHSLGGILVRAHLARGPLPNLGRVVMLAPPNRGSEIVDAWGDSPLFAWALGPTAKELGTDAESFPNRLPAPDYEVGVIAGTDSINPVGSALIPGQSDGTVSVESTQLPGMTDFVTAPVSHTFIMNSEEVQDQVVRFLKRGRFSEPDADHE